MNEENISMDSDFKVDSISASPPDTYKFDESGGTTSVNADLNTISAIASTSDDLKAPTFIAKLGPTNGLPKSGKPMMISLNEKNKKKITKRTRSKQKVPVAVYQSQIKDNNVGIKLCITKSSKSSDPPLKEIKQVQKHRRKTKNDGNDSETAPKRKRKKENSKQKSDVNLASNAKNQIQSPFGNCIPEHILYKVINSKKFSTIHPLLRIFFLF